MKQNFKRKLLAGLLSACMMFQTAGMVPVYAAGNAADSGLPSGTSSVCTHHVHDNACGYTEGTPCTFDPATCESCNPKDSNAQELPKENIAEAETISEPAPQTTNTATLNIKDGAIRISPTGYQICNGDNCVTTEHTGSYVITGTEQGDNPGSDYITVFSLASDATLTLKDLTIGSTKNQSALSLAGQPSVPEVCIEGTVSLGGQAEAIKANGALNLTGSGSLALSVSNSNNQGPATAVISAASVEATLGGDITVTATATHADNPAAIHAIKTSTGAVSLTLIR